MPIATQRPTVLFCSGSQRRLVVQYVIVMRMAPLIHVIAASHLNQWRIFGMSSGYFCFSTT